MIADVFGSAGEPVTGRPASVDAESIDGATRLYETVGMNMEQENVVWEKVIE